MKRIICLLVALIFLSGCALTTIRPPKKEVKREPQPVKRTVVEKVREVFKPQPQPERKEEILPVREEKEVVLPLEEEEIK